MRRLSTRMAKELKFEVVFEKGKGCLLLIDQ